MLCSPGFTGKGCKQSRDPAEYCEEKNCFQDTNVCKVNSDEYLLHLLTLVMEV